jgi:uridine kinase
MVIEVPDLCRRATAAPARLGGTRLVSVDGPAGSGKTTLAAALAEAFATRGVPVHTLHLDDLYQGWTGLGPEVESRVLAQVLVPLAAGRPARWQRYDWAAGAFAEWHRLDAPDVLVLEGCGSGARAFADYLSLLVWVDAPADVRLARGASRDGTEVLPKWRAWMAAEEALFAANDTVARADVRLSTG